MVSGWLRQRLISGYDLRLFYPCSHQVICSSADTRLTRPRQFSVKGETPSKSQFHLIATGFNRKTGGKTEDLRNRAEQATMKSEHANRNLSVVGAANEKGVAEIRTEMQMKDDIISGIASSVYEVIQKEREWELTLLSRLSTSQHQYIFHPSCFRKVLSGLLVTEPEIAHRYFLWLVSQDSYSPDLSTSTAIFQVILESRLWKAAIYAIHSIKCRPDPSSLEPFLKLLCECRALDEALEAIPAIKDIFGLIPSNSTWRCALYQSLRIGRSDLMWQFYGRMIEYNVKFDVSIVGCLIQAFCMEKRISEAYELVRRIARDGMIPDIVSFNRLVSGFCKGGKFKMVSEVLHLMILIGRPPEMSTYQEVIHGLCEHDNCIEALRVFNDLKRRGHGPDVITYNTVINGLCKMRRMDDALKLLQEMNPGGVHPTQRTYNCLVDGYSKIGSMDEAWRLYNEMVTKGLGESLVACNSIISGFCLLGNMEDARHVFEYMRKKHLKPDSITYNTLIQGFCKGGKTLEASDLLKELLQSNLQPTKSSYTYLIWSFCEEGNLHEARELFKDMESNGLEPLTVTRDYMISGFCKAGNLDEGLLWLSNMVHDNLQPSELTFNRVIGSLSLANRIDDAFLVLNLMFRFGYSLKGWICSTLISKLCSEKGSSVEEYLTNLLETS